MADEIGFPVRATCVFGEMPPLVRRMWRRGLVVETEFSTMEIGPEMVAEADRMIDLYNGGGR